MARGFTGTARGLQSQARALLCVIHTPFVKNMTHVGVRVRIACLGGGPGGLLAALLAKRSDPDREVTVFERNRPGDTFGFGVLFSDATLEGIHAADPILRRTLADHGAPWDEMEGGWGGGRWRSVGSGMAALTPKTLLSLLQQRATEAGVNIRFATLAEP